MMKYTPKELAGNVNISSISPLKDFGRLLLKILGVLLIIYILLGLALNYLAPRISIEMETKLGNLFARQFSEQAYPQSEEKVQGVLDALIQHADLPDFNYLVHIVDSEEVNAFALPAGHIVILQALLKEVESQNELAMVLAHELGHFAHRDHLQALGRGLVFLVLSSVTLGADSSLSRFIANSLINAEMKFSQAQERAADIYALELLAQTYGHVAGAADFYEKMSGKEKLGRFFYLFASHPYGQDRLAIIQETIKKRGYKVGAKIPLE